MNKISKKDVLSHPLILEIFKRNLASLGTLNYMISEEMLQEAPINTISNYFTTMLKKIEGPEKKLKAALDWLTKLEKGIKGKNLSSLFKTWEKFDADKKKAFLEAGAKYLETQKAGGPRTKMAALKAAIESTEGNKEEVKAIVATAVQNNLVPKEAAAELVGGAGGEDQDTDQSDPSFGKHILQSAAAIQQEEWYVPIHEDIQKIEKKQYANEVSASVAILLALMMDVDKEQQNEQVDPEKMSKETEGQISADKITNALTRMQNTYKAKNAEDKYNRFKEYIDSSSFSIAFAAAMSILRAQSQPEGSNITNLLPLEKSENEKIAKVATDPNNMNDDFDKSDAEVPKLDYDSYISQLDRFFGLAEDQVDVDPLSGATGKKGASFMKVFFLADQVSLLHNNLLSPLKNIINPKREGESGEQMAFTDVDAPDEKGEPLKPKANEEVTQFQDEEGNVVQGLDSEEEKEDYRTGMRAAVGTKAAIKSSYEWIKSLFATKNEEPIIEVSEKDKVALKRELAAQADLLVQCKKIADKYKLFSTRSSTDPEFDGSNLEKYLNNLLGKAQLHNARLVYIMAEIIKDQEQEAEAGRDIVGEADSKLDRNQKIKDIRKNYNQMGQIYKRSLRTSLENYEYVKAKKSAEKIMIHAKKIIPFFPKTIVNSANQVITLGDAIEALHARIRDYKVILRDIYETVEDKKIAPSHIGQMYHSIKLLCTTIQTNFDIPCKIRPEDIKTIEENTPDVLPTSLAIISPPKGPEKIKTPKPVDPTDPELKQIPTQQAPQIPTQQAPQIPTQQAPQIPTQQAPQIGKNTTPPFPTGKPPEKFYPDFMKNMPQIADTPSKPEEAPEEKEESPYYVSEKFDNAPLRQSYGDLEAKGEFDKYEGDFNFETDLQAWVDFFGPYLPASWLDNKDLEESPRKRDNEEENVAHIASNNPFVSKETEIKQQFKKMRLEEPLQADKVARMSFILSKQGKSVKDERGASVPNPFKPTAMALFKSIRKRKPETTKDIEEALIRKLIPIINPMVRGNNG